jgi:putative heme-binding domain-containing protein
MLLLAQQASVEPHQEYALEQGKKLFQSQCASCHGIDGSGGRGSPLNVPKLRRAAADDELRDVIVGGIGQAGMPGFWWLPPRDVSNVAKYVRSLGQIKASPIAGDRSHGRQVFESKGGCTSCHIVNGTGGWLGPELSDIGARRSTAYLRDALLDPAAGAPENIVFVRVETLSGQKFTGRRLNEDTFSIQIIDAAGRFQSLRKSSAASIERAPETPMPSFRMTLTDAEINDLVAYLASLTGK